MIRITRPSSSIDQTALAAKLNNAKREYEISERVTNALLPEFGWAGSVWTDEEGSVHINMVVLDQ